MICDFQALYSATLTVKRKSLIFRNKNHDNTNVEKIQTNSMNSDTQKKIDNILYETNAKISAIVDEIRNIRFSQMDENKKQERCDYLRNEFERVMFEEEKKIEEIQANEN